MSSVGSIITSNLRSESESLGCVEGVAGGEGMMKLQRCIGGILWEERGVGRDEDDRIKLVLEVLIFVDGRNNGKEKIKPFWYRGLYCHM